MFVKGGQQTDEIGIDNYYVCCELFPVFQYDAGCLCTVLRESDL